MKCENEKAREKPAAKELSDAALDGVTGGAGDVWAVEITPLYRYRNRPLPKYKCPICGQTGSVSTLAEVAASPEPDNTFFNLNCAMCGKTYTILFGEIKNYF